MEYTFGQAKSMLQSSAYLRGTTDVGTQINNAVLALAGLSGWEFLRRLVRTSSASPVFSLPQGAAELVRACVNGTPASLHKGDYQFLHSGPGDLEKYVARGFRRLSGGDVADLGYSATMYPVPEPVFLCAVSPYVTVAKPGGTTHPQPPITVSGYLASGEPASVQVPVIQGTPSAYPAYSSFGTQAFASVDHVVIGDNVTVPTVLTADEPVTLYAMTAHGSMFMLGHYHPDVKVPRFRQYRISPAVKGPYDILAEVRIDPLPCIDDSDVIPLPSLEPVKFMMLYEVALSMNEMATAQGYVQQAVQWLKTMEQTDNTIQAPVVQNVLVETSNGPLSDEFENL